jgi:MFS family permease
MNLTGPARTGDREAPTRFARLLPALFLGNAALFVLYIAAGTVLLPTQIALIEPDPVRKALDLSLVVGGAAVVAVVAQPVAGLLSDRSRRRNPWILCAGIGTALALLLVPGAHTVVLLAVSWGVASVFANTYQACLTAVVPDRIPARRRGTASAIVGAATPLAAVGGVVIAAGFATDPASGYLVLGLGVAAAGLLFVTLNPEARLPAAAPVSLARQGKSLVSALGHRDFRLAFLARAAMMTSFYLVFAYLLFLIQTRVSLPPGMTATRALTLLSAISAVMMVVGTLLGGILADRLRRYRVFVFASSVLMIAAALVAYLSTGLGAMVVYGVLTGLGFGCFLAVDTAIVTLVLPNAENAARDMGVLNIASAAPQTAAAVLSGVVVAVSGGGAAAYGNLFLVSIVFAALGGVSIKYVKAVR